MLYQLCTQDMHHSVPADINIFQYSWSIVSRYDIQSVYRYIAILIYIADLYCGLPYSSKFPLLNIHEYNDQIFDTSKSQNTKDHKNLEPYGLKVIKIVCTNKTSHTWSQMLLQ